MTYIYAAAGALILVFVFLILNKKKKTKADYLLIVINLLIACFMGADVWVQRALSSGAVIFQNTVPLLLFPTFVFYLLQFTHDHKGIHWRWYLTLIPAATLILLSTTEHYFLQKYPSDEDVLEHFNAPHLGYQLIFKGSQVLFVVLLFQLLGRLRNFDKEIKAGYSSIETIDVTWLRNFTLIYLGSIALTFILFLSQNVGLLPFDIQQVFGIVYGALVLSVFYLNYHGIRHYTLQQLSAKSPQPQEPLPTQTETPSKNEELTPKERLLEKDVVQLIEREQLYLNPKLSLPELAERMNENTHTISKVLNAEEGRSFYDLINGYRVQHLKDSLANPKNAHLTILAQGLDSGFNSKASLNRIFKNTTGITPRQYLDERSQSIG